jgi:hypothetical protein
LIHLANVWWRGLAVETFRGRFVYSEASADDERTAVVRCIVGDDESQVFSCFLNGIDPEAKEDLRQLLLEPNDPIALIAPGSFEMVQAEV